MKYTSFQIFFYFSNKGKRYTIPFLYELNIFEIYIVDFRFLH